MKSDSSDTKGFKTNYKGGSPLALETLDMLKKVPKPPKTEKQLVFENLKNDLLDESQLYE